jgi:EamA domain-containing membrane protein RarD
MGVVQLTNRFSGNSYGIFMSVFASSIFAAMPVYVQILQPMPGYTVTAQRVFGLVHGPPGQACVIGG